MSDNINLPPMTIAGSPPAPQSLGGNARVTVESSMVVVTGPRSVQVSLSNGENGDKTYDISLSRDGRSLTVTTGEPPRQVTGAELGLVRERLGEALESAEDSTLDMMSGAAPSTRQAPTANSAQNANTAGLLDRIGDLLDTARGRARDSAEDLAQYMGRSVNGHAPVDSSTSFEPPRRR